MNIASHRFQVQKVLSSNCYFVKDILFKIKYLLSLVLGCIQTKSGFSEMSFNFSKYVKFFPNFLVFPFKFFKNTVLPFYWKSLQNSWQNLFYFISLIMWREKGTKLWHFTSTFLFLTGEIKHGWRTRMLHSGTTLLFTFLVD